MFIGGLRILPLEGIEILLEGTDKFNQMLLLKGHQVHVHQLNLFKAIQMSKISTMRLRWFYLLPKFWISFPSVTFLFWTSTHHLLLKGHQVRAHQLNLFFSQSIGFHLV